MSATTQVNVHRQLAYPCRRCVRVGEVSLGLNADSFATLGLAPDLALFETESRHCDIEIEVFWSERIESQPGNPVFDSGSLWTLRLSGEEFQFDFATPVFGDVPYKRLCVNPGFSRTQLYLNRCCLDESQIVYPLEYPVDELLVTHWLARGRGIELHGCGLVDSGSGAELFLGHSGAGKSTTTQLWTSLRDVHVLSDDRIILRNRGSEVWMHGTPWHGEAGFASPGSAKISRIFLLEHGEENGLIELPRSKAAAELFARCFVPFYDRVALDFTLSYVHHIADSLPCYSYKFRPDHSSVEQILNFHE